MISQKQLSIYHDLKLSSFLAQNFLELFRRAGRLSKQFQEAVTQPVYRLMNLKHSIKTQEKV